MRGFYKAQALGALVGVVRKEPGVDREKAIARARRLPWYQPDLVVDAARDRRFFVFRRRRRRVIW